MQQIQHAVDSATGTVVSAAASAGALATAQNIALVLFGVPLFVVLAGFAGVFYGLTFREPMKPVLLWGNIILMTFLATASGAMLLAYWAMPPAALAGASAVAGFALQVLQPWLKKNLPGVLDSIRDKYLPQRRDDDGGQS